jgi:hypothetical protein
VQAPSTRPVAVAAPVARQSNSRFAALDDDEEETAPMPMFASATIAPAPLSSTQPVNLFPSLSAKVAPIASNSVARVSYSSAFKSSDAPSTWKLRIVPTVEVEEVIEEYDSDDDEVYEKTVTVKVSVPAPMPSLSSTIAPASSPTAKPKVIFSCLDIFNKSLSKKVAPLKKLNTYAENKVEPEEYFVQEEDKLDYATERYLAKFEVKKPTYAEKINPVLSRSYHYDNPYYNYDW